MSEHNNIRGAGGSDEKQPYEASDTLRSRQIAEIVDVLCEGPIVGLIDGPKSVFLNETVLMNDDGSLNFNNIGVQWRNGTQNQSAMDGFDTVEAETMMGAEVKFGLPITGHLGGESYDSVRVTVSVGALTEAKDNGDLVGSQVGIEIYIQTDSAGFPETPILTDTISGKCVSKYQQSYVIALPPSQTGSWDIRVKRTKEDASNVKVQDRTYFDSFTGIINSRLSYPNSALVGTTVDSAQFNNIPSRSFHVKGMIVQVPSNYTPATRDPVTGVWTPAVYTGIWDGTFVPKWTSNPAWCFQNLLLNKRYGLGNYISAELVDKWGLYSIAKYCDEMVLTGYDSSLEPRFTCNLYLQTREEAFRVIQNFASIFRAITFWGSSTLLTMQDSPADPVALYTNANVQEGFFSYSGTSIKQRHTVALITWNDPKDMYKQKVEYVQDFEGIKELGIIDTSAVAFGCTSRGQAHRMGKWMLVTERLATEAINFKVGLDGCGLYPGAIISTSDMNRAQVRMGGRITAATENTVTLDADFEVEAGQSYSIRVTSLEEEEGAAELTPKLMYSEIGNGVGVHRTLNLLQPLSSIPAKNAVFIIAATDVNPETWRVLNVKEAGPNLLDVACIAHIPELFDLVEQGIAFEPLPTTNVKVKPEPPTDFNAVPSRYMINGQLLGARATVSWNSRASRFRFNWRKADAAWTSKSVYGNTFDIDNIELGVYEFSVVAISPLGIESSAATMTANLGAALQAVPSLIPPVDELLPLDPLLIANEAAFIGNNIFVKWYQPPGATQYLVEAGTAPGPRSELFEVKRRVDVGNALRFQYSAEDMRLDGGPWREVFIRVTAFGALGAVGDTYSEINCTNPQLAALTGINFASGVGSIFFSCDTPEDLDFSGVNVYMSTVSGFTPQPSDIVYSGAGTQATIATLPDGSPIDATVPYYFRAAGFDAFDQTGLVMSGQFTAQCVSLTSATALSSIGPFANAPDPEAHAINSVYTNTTDGNAYVLTLVNGAKAWTIFVAKGAPGSATTDPITAFLSNESVTVAADSAGNIGAIPAAVNGLFRVFEGVTEVTGATVAYSVESQTGLTIAINASGVYTISGVSADSGTAVLRATFKNVSIDKTYSIGKAKAGINGEAPPILSLTTTAQTIKYDGAGVATPASQSVVVTAIVTNIPTGTLAFTYRLYDAAGTALAVAQAFAGSGNSRTFTNALMGAAAYAVISATKGVGADTTTIVRLQDGVGGTSAKLIKIDATSQVVAVDNDGVVSPSLITVSAQQQNIAGTPTFTLMAGVVTGLSFPITANSFNITAANIASESITIRSTSTTGGLTDHVTINKLYDGVNAISGFLTNESIVLPADKNGAVLSYTGASGKFHVYDGTEDVTDEAVFAVHSVSAGLSSQVPANVTGAYSFTAGFADAADSAYIIWTATYRGVVIEKTFTLAKSREGSTGVDGRSVATVNAYQRSPTPPVGTPGPVVYHFASATITTFPLENGWLATMPEGDDPLYITVASASATAETDLIGGNEWSGHVVMAKNGEDYSVHVESTNGDTFRVGQPTTTYLIAHVFRNGEEITDSIPDSKFRWRRVSYYEQQAPNDDATWNAAYASGYKQIMLTIGSLDARATFHCDILE